MAKEVFLNNPPQHPPIIFGEVLYDIFEQSGQQVLGGAPFNVAWHLQGLGLSPILVTRVGTDDNGKAVIQAMQQWRMDQRCVQQDNRYPTGQVRVKLQAGQPSYEIPLEQAYDYIDGHQALDILQNSSCGLFYHGSLALRQLSSQQALNLLVDNLHLPIFLDINLRSPWWTPELIEESLQRATWVKLNDEEMRQLAPEFQQSEDDTVLENFCQHYQLQILVVTLGAEGAILKMPANPLIKISAPAVSVIDAVGAGDAFSAMLIAGIYQQWTPKQMLERAAQFAAQICQIPGATTLDAQLYQKMFT